MEQLLQPPTLSDCIQHLLHFTLSSSINQTLEFDLRLSSEYCSNLLQIEPNQSIINDLDEASGGVPSYPLYKHLALALVQCIHSGAFVGTSDYAPTFAEDDSVKRKKDSWDKLIQERGNELLNMLKDVEFELHVQEPYFTQLRDCVKIIEGRCAVGDYNSLEDLHGRCPEEKMAECQRPQKQKYYHLPPLTYYNCKFATKLLLKRFVHERSSGSLRRPHSWVLSLLFLPKPNSQLQCHTWCLMDYDQNEQA